MVDTTPQAGGIVDSTRFGCAYFVSSPQDSIRRP